ncbi:MAG: shikimate dehydrogenase [Sphingobacteriaceae bacterium]|nr:shikimate dehydrogenase [Sphingobacteriaceae bacterium]
MAVIYGVLGKKLSHSFSKKYFENKFKTDNLSDYLYYNFEFDHLDLFFEHLKTNTDIKGFNITNPYKVSIIPYLDEISEEAKEINAINCVKIINGKKIGFNTDAFGFSTSIKPFLEPTHERALILGTGGAAKAVAFSLNKIGITNAFVTSDINKKNKQTFTYDELGEGHFKSFKLIVNATPCGMYPNVKDFPKIPFEQIESTHLCYDLIYNPEKTKFLEFCEEQGASVMNGLSMLHLQAEKAWEIWNER